MIIEQVKGKKKINYGNKLSFRLPYKMDTFITNLADQYGLSKTEIIRDIILDVMMQRDVEMVTR